MSRPIDADALMRAMYHRAFETDGDTMWQSGCWIRYRAVEQVIKESPPVTPKQKKGKWIYGEDNPGTGRDGWFCSECEHFEMWDYSADMKSAELNLPNFCPNCGARMTEEDV